MLELLHAVLQGFFVLLADLVSSVLRHVDTVPDANGLCAPFSVRNTDWRRLRVRVAEVGRNVVVELVHLVDRHHFVGTFVDDRIPLRHVVPDERPGRVLVVVPLLTVVLGRVRPRVVSLLAQALEAFDGPREDSRELVFFDPGLEAKVGIHIPVVGVLREPVGELDEELPGVERSLGILRRRDAVRGEDHLCRVLHLGRRLVLALYPDVVLAG